jgi:hypothetical protein
MGMGRGAPPPLPAGLRGPPPGMMRGPPPSGAPPGMPHPR